MKVAIDPALKNAVEAMGTLTIRDADSLRIAREWGETPIPPLGPPAPQPVEEWIETGAGRLRVVLVEPEGHSSERPVVLQFHGGGFIVGKPELRIPVLQQAASELGVVIVAVDYRLAPEHPAPAALEDGLAAYEWVAATARQRRWDPSRIALMGESAGGGLAASLALRLRDRGASLSHLVLVYPMLDDRTTAAGGEIGKYVWDAESNAFGWDAYLSDRTDEILHSSVPARVSDLSGLPPTWIGVGTADLFAQEDVAFAQRLADAQVPVELHVEPGGYHGFDQFAPDADASRRFQASWFSALATAFAR